VETNFVKHPNLANSQPGVREIGDPPSLSIDAAGYYYEPSAFTSLLYSLSRKKHGGQTACCSLREISRLFLHIG
jgi:hypothetical protein